MFYLNKNKIICNQQYGFRKNYSTNMVIFNISDYIYNSLDQNKYCAALFLDLRKAFDTVNHGILLKKLHHYGIRNSAHSWFSSYLSSRYQQVQINNTLSSPLLVEIGVPQGSVLGPILFLIYINDFINASKILSFRFFADDTVIFIKHHNIQILRNIMNSELKNISNWLKANKLSINLQKLNL